MTQRRLVSGVELAGLLGVTPETIRAWRKSSIIPAVVINATTIRYDHDEVVAALKSRSEAIHGADKATATAGSGGVP